MPSFYWFKVHNEILEDRKIHQMPGELFKRFMFLAAMASRDKIRDGRLPEIEEMAWCLHCDESELLADLELLSKKYNMVHNEKGIWFVTNFSKRQEASSNAERQAQYRDRQRKDNYDSNEPVTNCYTEIELNKDIEIDAQFSLIQKHIEQTTGVMASGPSSVKAIDELIKAKATPEDIKAGYEWLIDNDKTVRYYSQLVGPTKTAIAKRLGNNNKKSRPDKSLEGYTPA